MNTLPMLPTDEDAQVKNAIEDVHLFIRNGMMPKTWKGYLQLLDGRLDFFLGTVDE